MDYDKEDGINKKKAFDPENEECQWKDVGWLTS